MCRLMNKLQGNDKCKFNAKSTQRFVCVRAALLCTVLVYVHLHAPLGCVYRWVTLSALSRLQRATLA